MRVIEAVPSLGYGDAVGNDVVAQKRALTAAGYRCEIYADWIDERLPSGTAQNIKKYKPQPDDILIYHFSSGNEMCYKVAQLSCSKIIRYHNVTPPEYFRAYDANAYEDTSRAMEAVKALSGSFNYGLAASDFNRQDLVSYGYGMDIDVMPVLVAFDDYAQVPSAQTMAEYSDGKVNIIFTGRIAPNKRFENIIRAYYYYKQINTNSRLIFAGSGVGERYYQKLMLYIAELKLKDIIFTGHISFKELLAIWRTADVYLTMSEHEGFGVPLVEAMYFGVPIVAHAAAAIPETLGGSGVLLPKSDSADEEYMLAAEVIHELVCNEEFRCCVVDGQKERLKDFKYERITKQMIQSIDRLVK